MRFVLIGLTLGLLAAHAQAAPVVTPPPVVPPPIVVSAEIVAGQTTDTTLRVRVLRPAGAQARVIWNRRGAAPRTEPAAAAPANFNFTRLTPGSPYQFIAQTRNTSGEWAVAVTLPEAWTSLASQPMPASERFFEQNARAILTAVAASADSTVLRRAARQVARDVERERARQRREQDAETGVVQ